MKNLNEIYEDFLDADNPKFCIVDHHTYDMVIQNITDYIELSYLKGILWGCEILITKTKLHFIKFV